MKKTEQPREPKFYPNENILLVEDKKGKNVHAEERELLHKQLELLAERSKGCLPCELAELSAQMVAIYNLLKL